MMRVWMPGVTRGRAALAAAAILLLAAAQAGARQPAKSKDADCLACHGDSTLSKDENGKSRSLFIDKNKLGHSIHGSMFACVDCHTDVKGPAHETTPKKVECASCHADAQQAFSHSLHARASQQGKVGATCQDCHGDAHAILPAGDPASPVAHKNIPQTCGR
jgi:formate-dependent nitrite reductase cytochrome c552 subunit